MEPPLDFDADHHGVACHVFGPVKRAWSVVVYLAPVSRWSIGSASRESWINRGGCYHPVGNGASRV